MNEHEKSRCQFPFLSASGEPIGGQEERFVHPRLLFMVSPAVRSLTQKQKRVEMQTCEMLKNQKNAMGINAFQRKQPK